MKVAFVVIIGFIYLCLALGVPVIEQGSRTKKELDTTHPQPVQEAEHTVEETTENDESRGEEDEYDDALPEIVEFAGASEDSEEHKSERYKRDVEEATHDFEGTHSVHEGEGTTHNVPEDVSTLEQPAVARDSVVANSFHDNSNIKHAELYEEPHEEDETEAHDTHDATDEDIGMYEDKDVIYTIATGHDDSAEATGHDDDSAEDLDNTSDLHQMTSSET